MQTRELTQQTLNADAREPAWSQEGEIAFSTAPCDECQSEIRLDTSGSTEIPVDTTVHHVFAPTWAPDGNRFAVIRLGRGIFAVEVASRAIKQLTFSPADEAPAWSPSGDWIAFDRLRRSTNYELYAVHAGTGEMRRLTERPRRADPPRLVAGRLPPGVRRATVERKVGDLHDGLRRERAQARHGQPDQRPGAGLVAGRQEDRVHPAGARPRHARSDKRRRDGRDLRTHRRALFPSRPAWSPDGTSVAFAATVVPEPRCRVAVDRRAWRRPPPPTPPTRWWPRQATSHAMRRARTSTAGSGRPTRCRRADTSDLLPGSGLAAVLPLGDAQYCCGTLPPFTRSYDLAWGRVQGISTRCRAPMNTATRGAAGYFDYFNGAGALRARPATGTRATTASTSARWHLVALNTQLRTSAAQPARSRSGGCARTSPHTRRLHARLHARAALQLDARAGRPRCGAMEALYEAGAEIVLGADAQQLRAVRRAEPRGPADPAFGIRQFVVGTGGYSLGRFGADQEATARCGTRTASACCELTLQASGYAWRSPEPGRDLQRHRQRRMPPSARRAPGEEAEAQYRGPATKPSAPSRARRATTCCAAPRAVT